MWIDYRWLESICVMNLISTFTSLLLLKHRRDITYNFSFYSIKILFRKCNIHNCNKSSSWLALPSTMPCITLWKFIMNTHLQIILHHREGKWFIFIVRCRLGFFNVLWGVLGWKILVIFFSFPFILFFVLHDLIL